MGGVLAFPVHFGFGLKFQQRRTLGKRPQGRPAFPTLRTTTDETDIRTDPRGRIRPDTFHGPGSRQDSTELFHPLGRQDLVQADNTTQRILSSCFCLHAPPTRIAGPQGSDVFTTEFRSGTPWQESHHLIGPTRSLLRPFHRVGFRDLPSFGRETTLIRGRQPEPQVRIQFQ